MKFLYIQSYQPCAPQEIRRDRDVKIFLRQVTEVVPATSLYVEMFPRDVDNRFGTFNSGSGSNHFSTSCPSTKVRDESFIYAQNVEKAKVHESPIRENIFRETFFRESPIRDNHVWESPIRETQTPWETLVPEMQIPEAQHVQETQLPPSQVPVTKIPSSHQSRTKPIEEENSVPRTFTTSLPSGSSHFVDIESGAADSDEFRIGQVYDDKKNLKQKLSLYAVTQNFQFKVVRSSTTRYEVRCFHDTCKWKLRANKIPHSERLWMVKAYFGEHACLQYSQAANGNHRQATSRVIGDAIKEKYDGIANEHSKVHIY